MAILGGSKVQKANAIISGLNTGLTDMVLVGGVPAEAVLVAAQMVKGKDYSDKELLALATQVLGPSAANLLEKADDGKFFALLPSLAKAIQDHSGKIALPVDMSYMDGENARVVTLVNGRVPTGFDHVLSGIGPQTDAYFSSIASGTANPFQSADLAGPLVDLRYEVLLQNMRKTAQAVSKIKVWATGGGDIDVAISKLGFSAPFKSLAGGARQDFIAGKNIPGIDAAIKNSPVALKNKPYVPATDAEAHVLAHTTVFHSLGQAIKNAGGKLVARTGIFVRGQSVGNIKVSPVPMDTAIRLSLGDLSNAFSGMEVMDIDGQNPWIDFSMTTLRTPANDRRQLSLEATRQVLATDPNVALILLQGEYSAKKGKFGAPGEVKTQTVEERLNAALLKALRQRGIDSFAISKTQRPLPAIVQVTESTIPGQLKMATFVPTPKSDIYRLMQLAQDSGINIKAFLEESTEINDPGFVVEMKTLKVEPQIPLLKEALPLPAAMQKYVEPESTEFNQLKGLTFRGSKINVNTQTIISKDSTAGYAIGDSFIDEVQSILGRVERSGKLVKIMIPEKSSTVAALQNMINALIKDNARALTVSTHSVVRGNEKFTAFIIAPQVPYIIVGYGNEAIKVAPTLEASGFGTPAVAINSLDRIERVIHAFFMGYDIYHADQVLVDKETKKEGFLYEREPGKLVEFEAKLYKALESASIVNARNELLAKLTLSERSVQSKINSVYAEAVVKGSKEANDRFAKQYKGLLSAALKSGKFKVVVDATPEKIGAQNKKLLYEPAAKLYPNTIFIYQGGEEEAVGFSFSNVSADYNTILLQKHIRHVSCNTTALSTEVISLMQYLNTTLSIDNTAIRRVADPGDAKGGVAATQLAFSYHHGPDLILVTPDNIKAALEIPGMKDKKGNQLYYVNTDAAQSGGVTMYHHHILTLTRLDGKAIDINEVKKVLAARPDVALVDFPSGVFNTVRIVELSHNLLPQAIRNAPDGANHVLVPVVMVKATDDPSEVILMYAVPQESIVARGQAHVIHAALNMASKDASTEIVDDATGATALVQAIETRLAGDPSFMTSTATEEIPTALTASSAIKSERVPFVGGNWKMAIQSQADAVKLLEDLASKIGNQNKTDTIIAPSTVHIPAVSAALKRLIQEGKVSEGAIKIAAQNMYSEEKGAFTSGISATQLKEYGVTHVILGHSEVRRNKFQEPTGESNRNVNKKVVTALSNSLVPIVCVGESDAEKNAGKEKEVVKNQVWQSLAGITSPKDIEKLVIAYEPVWAIGTGKTATPQQAQDMHSFIRGILAEMFNSVDASKIRILYGGSVTADNMAGFMAQPDIDGALVGGASLKADSFSGIVQGASTSSSPTITDNSKKGGIDFRPAAMTIKYQPMGNFTRLNPKLPILSQAQLAVFDIDKELSGIEKMVEGQIVPSGERIKELLAACSQKGELGINKERLMVLMVKIGILEETQCCLEEASQGYKEALVLTDSLA
ncbi:MAG: triose-phosphate isomerase [Candidatus Omnitrophica bacterium]|nr:triose-phosphate isomerase [Candidatus Omnitrophota bacterium]